MTPFECVYGLNPLTPLDLTPLPSDVVISLEGNQRAESMENLHEKARLHLEMKNQDMAKKVKKR